jgi:hypothetical protein
MENNNAIIVPIGRVLGAKFIQYNSTGYRFTALWHEKKYVVCFIIFM